MLYSHLFMFMPLPLPRRIFQFWLLTRLITVTAHG